MIPLRIPPGVLMQRSCLAFVSLLLVVGWASTATADLLGLRNKQLSMLRVVEVGSKHGPPGDQLDAEVIVRFAGTEGDFGFQLRDDGNRPVREGMLALLRDAFNHGWDVNIDYSVDPPEKNGVILRVWLTKP